MLQIGDGNVRGGVVLPAREHGRDMQPYLSSFPLVENGGFGSDEHQTGIGLCRPSVVIRFQVCIFDILNTAQFI